MKSNALSQLDVDATTAKRAQYEGFEFTIEAPGRVRVTNGSYGAAKNDHSYTVTVEDGVSTECTCPSDEHRPGACKHRVAVAIRKPIMDVSAGTPARADGGTVLPPEPQGVDAEDTDADGESCDCAGFDPGSLPCFECYLSGVREVPER